MAHKRSKPKRKPVMDPITPMDDSATRRYKDLIQTALKALTDSTALGAEAQKVVTLDQQAVGRLSRMDALQNQAMAKALDGRRSTEAQRLRAALARLDAGEYGYCDDCGDRIPDGRLALDLAATRCVSCAAG